MAQSEIKMKMSLDGSGVKKTLNRTKASIKNFAKSGVASIARFGAAFAGIGLIKSIVGLGTAAAETASKFDAVFGKSADAMNKKVQELRKTIPATTAEMQGALATFAQMAKAFGLNSDAANLFSVEMVKIAGDIASFNDLPIEDAFTKIRSAISGEFEPMKQLGIVINETRLKQEALSLAIWDGTGQMSAAQKALAVQSILIRDMGDANGDAALTANSAANKIKFLQKSLKETGTEIGNTILPGVVALTKAFSNLLSMTNGAMEGVGTALGELIYGDADRIEATGNLERRGVTMGRGKGGAEKYKKQVKDEIALIQKRREEEKKAAAEKAKKNEDDIKNAGDLKGEIEKQIEAEKDPARKKALEDRLAAYQKLIEAAGKLNSITKELTAVEKINQQIKKAEIEGNAYMVTELKKQLEVETQIAQIMKETGVERKEAINLAHMVNLQKSREVGLEEEISEEKREQVQLLEKHRNLQRDINSMKVGSGGDAFEGLSTEKLKFLLSDTQKQFRKLDRSITSGSGWTSRKAIVQMAGGATLQTDINRIEKELELRRKFTSAPASARSLQFDPFQQERLNRVTQGEKETTKLLRNISTDLKGINRTTSRLDSSLT